MKHKTLRCTAETAALLLTVAMLAFLIAGLHQHDPDRVLSTLSMGMVNRNIFKVEISTEPFSEERKEEITRQIGKQLDIPLSEAGYFISTPSIEKNMYDPADDSIDILYNDGSIKNIAEASDMLNISLLSKKVKKYYLCYQRLHR